MIVRLADPTRDAGAIAEIDRPAVETSLASFEEVAPDAAETGLAHRPSTLVRIPGWWQRRTVSSSATRTRPPIASEPAPVVDQHRPANVHPDAQGRGVGRRLYDRLLAILRRQGFVNAYAGITLPNPASVRRRHRDRDAAGRHLRGGRLQTRRMADVAWYELRLAERQSTPAEPIPLRSLPAPALGSG